MKKYIELILGLSGMIYGLFSSLDTIPATVICILAGYILSRWLCEIDSEFF